MSAYNRNDRMGVRKVKAAETLTVGLVMMGLLLSLCSGVLLARETIKVWTFLNPMTGNAPRERALRQIITNFEQANPDLKVVVEPQIWDKMTGKFYASAQAGNAPDIQWVEGDDLGQGYQLGVLADLNELFINSWSQAEKDDFYCDAFWDYGATDGGKYQITIFGNAILPTYRTDMFEAAGIDVPIGTWDDFVKAGQKLTQDLDGDGETDVWGFGQAFAKERTDNTVFVFATIESQGDIFTAGGKPQWSTDAGVKAMKLQTDMVTKYKITPPGAVTYTVEELYEGFKAGKYAMIMGSVVRFKKTQEEVPFDSSYVGLTDWPTWTGDKLGPVNAEGWCGCVWSDSPVLKQAGKFMEFMQNKQSWGLWSKVGGQIPQRKSVLEDPYFQTADTQWIRTIAQGWQERSYAVPWLENTSGFMIDLNGAAQEILLEGKDVKQALVDAEKRFIASR